MNKNEKTVKTFESIWNVNLFKDARGYYFVDPATNTKIRISYRFIKNEVNRYLEIGE